MTPLQRYIAEEIATDHVDGLLSRREALRRLALLGVGTAAATALIAACGENKRPTSDAPVTSNEPATASAPPPGSENTVPSTPITWAGPRGELQAAWAPAPDPRGGVLVIHENKGLNDYIRSVAGRFAGIGYSALAIDLLSAQGGTGTFADPAEATAALGKLPPEEAVADLKSGIDELQRRVPDKKVAAVGFCMGGGMVWRLLASGEPRLAAAVPFYGPTPDNPDFAGSKDVAVLGIYAAQDQRVNATEPVARAALEKAGLVFELVTEPDANHAFFNDTGDRYNATAAERCLAPRAGLVHQVPRLTFPLPRSQKLGRSWEFARNSAARSCRVVDRTCVQVKFSSCGWCRSRTSTARVQGVCALRWIVLARSTAPGATKSSWSYRGGSPNGTSCRRESFESPCQPVSSRSPADIVPCCPGPSPNC